MEQNEAKDTIRQIAAQGVLTQEEALEAYNEGASHTTVSSPGKSADTRKVTITAILSYIGGGIIFVGIVILLVQNWETLSVAVKLLITFGISILAMVIGTVLSRREHLDALGQATYLIAVLTWPVGLIVLVEMTDTSIEELSMQTAVATFAVVTMVMLYRWVKRLIFQFFAICYGTWLYFAATTWMLKRLDFFEEEILFGTQALIAGIVYILYGRRLSRERTHPLCGVLYSFGILGVLGGAFLLSGFDGTTNIFWVIIFPFVVFGAFSLSVYLKHRSFLVFGALFLMIYIFRITSEYFSDSLGWPISLMIVGAALIGIGYLSIWLNRKYFKRRHSTSLEQ